MKITQNITKNCLNVEISFTILSGAGEFYLAYGLKKLIRDTNTDVGCLQTFFRHRNEKRRLTFRVGHHTTLLLIFFFKVSIFQIIGKKNNQSSVSNEDREIPTLVSMDNAGISVNLVSGSIRLPSGWDFSVCIGY